MPEITYSKAKKQLCWDAGDREEYHGVLVGVTTKLNVEQVQELADLVFDNFEHTLTFFFIADDVFIYVGYIDVTDQDLNDIRWFVQGWLQAHNK